MKKLFLIALILFAIVIPIFGGFLVYIEFGLIALIITFIVTLLLSGLIWAKFVNGNRFVLYLIFTLTIGCTIAAYFLGERFGDVMMNVITK